MARRYGVFGWHTMHACTVNGSVNSGLAPSDIDAMQAAENAMQNPAATLAQVVPLEISGDDFMVAGPALIGMRATTGGLKWYSPDEGLWLRTAEMDDGDD